MNIDTVPMSTQQNWKDKVAIRIINCLPENQVSKGVRSPHSWIIAAMVAVLTLVYYAGHTPLAHFGGFLTTAYPHDLHRVLFLFPIIYAAVAFRIRGALSVSAAFLCVVLPRAFFYSPYSDPLVRSLLSTLLMMFAGFLVAALVNRVEEEEKARAELSRAHQELAAYVQRLKENEEQLFQAEKLTSLGQLAASIAHEIKNPMAGILVYTQLLSKKLAGETLKKEEALGYLSKMELEMNRCSRIIRNLLDFSRQTEPTLRLVDINQVLEQALSMVGHQAQLQHIEVVREFGSLPKVTADFDQLQQVFINLTLNAIQAMPDGGKLTIRSLVTDGEVRVDVQDTGYGIPKENLSNLFTPFFTTKEKGKGVGLGLSVVHGIIERHEGKVKVQSEVGKGTTFSVYLGIYGDEKSQDTGC
jgi:signal transduction histidine kinase